MGKRNCRGRLRMPVKLQNILALFAFQTIDILSRAHLKAIQERFLFDMETLLK